MDSTNLPLRNREKSLNTRLAEKVPCRSFHRDSHGWRFLFSSGFGVLGVGSGFKFLGCVPWILSGFAEIINVFSIPIGDDHGLVFSFMLVRHLEHGSVIQPEIRQLCLRDSADVKDSFVEFRIISSPSF